MLNIGLLGCGRIGQVHAKSMRDVPGARISALSDAIPGAAEKLASETGATVATSENILREPGIDAVIIATPTTTHYDLIHLAAAEGKAILCEKPVDLSAERTRECLSAASAAGVPLVYVNREPVNVNELPDKQAFVASNEIESGTLESFQICRNLRAEGKAGGAKGYILMGQLSNQAAVQRTKDVDDVIGMDMCNFMTIIDRQTAEWSRDKAQDLMSNWLSSGEDFDFVIANNDEMAIGAIQAMKASGYDMATIQVGGVDATQDALVAMQAGDLDVTVFQDANGQGAGSVKTALKLARGEGVDKKVYIPFKLVTPDNVAGFLNKN